MQLEQMTRDREAESQPAVPARGAAVGLAKRSKMKGRNSGAMPMPESVTAIAM